MASLSLGQTLHVTGDGWAILHRDRIRDEDFVRSYDSRGRCFVLIPPPIFFGRRLALDVESLDTVPPTRLMSLSKSSSKEELFARWTVAEVYAKLLDVPIILWLRTFGLPDRNESPLILDPSGIRVRTIFTNSYVISFGYMALPVAK